jgi:hypothetical protein
MKKRKFHTTMFVVYTALFLLFVIKTMHIRKPALHKPTPKEVIQHSFDEPKDYVEDKQLPESKREYYEYLYHKSK